MIQQRIPWGIEPGQPDWKSWFLTTKPQGLSTSGLNNNTLLICILPWYNCETFRRFTVTNRLKFFIREDACSGTGGIFIRDTALDTAYSLWFNELWPNQGQTMRNHTPYHTAYATVWRMILGRMHALNCKKKSVVNHFKNRLKLW